MTYFNHNDMKVKEFIELLQTLDKLNQGDRVRVLIVKEDEK